MVRRLRATERGVEEVCAGEEKSLYAHAIPGEVMQQVDGETHAQTVAATSSSLPSRHLRLSSSWPKSLILSLLTVPELLASPLLGVEVRDFCLMRS